ncbi:hypothetical protein ACQRDF_04010 [Lachnospiraceae bacterium SGI.054]
MNKSDNKITFSAFYNNITIHFYEDDQLMENAGKTFGLDIKRDYFLAISFLYPSDMVVSYDEKYSLMQLLSPLTSYGPLNAAIAQPQMIFCDKGTSMLLASHTKEELASCKKQVVEKAIAILTDEISDGFVRIGIGTVENSLSGIEKTFRNSICAINAGEKFKKERRVLDFIGMEIYSAINAMVLAHGDSLISTILLQLTEEEQTILGKYYKCKEEIPQTAAALNITTQEVTDALTRVKTKTGLDVHDTEDNFKLNFVMIAKRVLEKEKRRR